MSHTGHFATASTSPSTSSQNREDGQNRQNVAKIDKAKISGLCAVGQFFLALRSSNKYPRLKTCRRTGKINLILSVFRCDEVGIEGTSSLLRLFRRSTETCKPPEGGLPPLAEKSPLLTLFLFRVQCSTSVVWGCLWCSQILTRSLKIR